MKFIIPEQVETALKMLNEAGYSAYVVGGAVRNLVMGIPVNDWDITTSALPDQTKSVFKNYKTIDTGLKHGTVTVVIKSMHLEITTFRIDSDYSDRRRPDEVLFTDSLSEDLSRRDFTCNALAYSPDKGIVDIFGGISDIENKTVRCVGDPDKRFNEDALRILRALRFASVLGFEIDKTTSESVFRNCSLLDYISKERIFVELSKLICGINTKNILTEYSDIIFFVIPELKAMSGCSQNHERHIFDVWGHTVESVCSIRNTPELRFAMLFHDSGKPDVKTTDEKGIDHFYRHALISAEKTEKALSRLKTSNSFRKEVVNLVRYHDFVPNVITRKTYRKYIGILGRDTMYKLFEVREADIRGQNPAFLVQELENNRIGLAVLDEIIESNDCVSIRDLAVNGSDLISEGFDPSPEIGKIIDILLEEVISDKTPNDKNALIQRAKEIHNVN